MAIAIPVPLDNDKASQILCNRIRYSLDHLEPLSDIMSYQYPPPQGTDDMDMPQSGYMTGYPAQTSSPMEVRPVQQALTAPPPPPTLPAPPVPPAPQVPTVQDIVMPLPPRREPLSRAFRLKRSFSTPNVRQQGTSGDADHALGLGGEKRRNKLGYHRTSVACGHCRRRKIRCIPAPADFHGRCQNCIRLKKECTFLTVDQQLSTIGQKSGSRSSTGTKMASASSSPAIASGHAPDMQTQQAYQHLTGVPSMPNMTSHGYKTTGTDPYSDPKVASSATYSHGVANWMPADTSPVSRPYPHESPVTPGFSPYTTHGTQPAGTWPTPLGVAGADPASRADDMTWSSYQAPPRSMSFSSDHSQQYQSLTQTTSPQDRRHYDRRSASMTADMYPSPITTSMTQAGSVLGTADDPHGSLSAGSGAPPAYNTWGQHYSYSRGDSYAGWYADNGASGADEHGASSENPYYGGR